MRNDPRSHYKACVHCGASKSTAEFPAMAACRDGLSSWCKQCHRAAAKASSAKRRSEINISRRRPQRSVACAECGTVILSSNPARRFCSRLCYHRGNVNEYRHRKRSAPRAMPFRSHVSRHAIAERDAWTCQLCLGPIDRATIPTLDHIIPLSRGGGHTADNVQLAHLSCNARKGNRVAA
jgi:5-methylcytosine-specific restriction endonuclease McrA